MSKRRCSTIALIEIIANIVANTYVPCLIDRNEITVIIPKIIKKAIIPYIIRIRMKDESIKKYLL